MDSWTSGVGLGEGVGEGGGLFGEGEGVGRGDRVTWCDGTVLVHGGACGELGLLGLTEPLALRTPGVAGADAAGVAPRSNQSSLMSKRSRPKARNASSKVSTVMRAADRRERSAGPCWAPGGLRAGAGRLTGLAVRFFLRAFALLLLTGRRASP